ncbi:MAG: RNA polymerase sigma factor [Tangfeifania sp.]
MEFEKQIINQIIQGDTNQFEYLVKKYQNPVFKVIYKIVGDYEDAAEILQDVFVKAFESFGQYNPEYKFFSWIYRIAINKAILFAKQRKVAVPVEILYCEVVDDREEMLFCEQRDNLIAKAVNRLDKKYRKVILLKYYGGLSYMQIAEVLQLPEKTVKSRLFDARKILQKSLVKMELFSSIRSN